MSDFSEFNLDQRLQKAMNELEWLTPTDIQKETLSKSLAGDHLLIRSKTGTGKTGIYLITIIEHYIRESSSSFYNRSLILVPSHELTNQIEDVLSKLLKYMKKIKYINTSRIVDPYETILDEYHIIISTPKKMVDLFDISALSQIDSIVITIFDEADLLFSYGHHESLNTLSNYLSPRQQFMILSATLTSDVECLCTVHLVNPVRVILDDTVIPESDQLSHYLLKCEPEDKFLILYSLVVLKLINGKILIFCNEINNCYKIMLFFKTFSIKSLVLNKELPLNTRLKSISKFNKNKIQILIAPDLPDNTTEFNVSRGLDFSNVDTVINFDVPIVPESYIHRVGRTARANSVGVAITFATIKENELLHELEYFLSNNSENKLQLFKFLLNRVEGFRYRVEDACRSISKSAIVNARRLEIKEEIINSEKVKKHFNSKPIDKQIFKADLATRKPIFPLHLAKLPYYLVPDCFKETYNSELNKSKNFVINRRKAFMEKKMKRRSFKKDPLKASKKSKPKN